MSEKSSVEYVGVRATLDRLDAVLASSGLLADQECWDARRALGEAIGLLAEHADGGRPVTITARTFPVYGKNGALREKPVVGDPRFAPRYVLRDGELWVRVVEMYALLGARTGSPTSCLLCGRAKPFAVWHEPSGVGACVDCAARAATTEGGTTSAND